MKQPQPLSPESPILAPEILNELERLDREATAGPLHVPVMPGLTQRRAILDSRGGEVCDGPYERLRDLRLFVALRNAAPSLLSAARERDRLRALLQRLVVATDWTALAPLHDGHLTGLVELIEEARSEMDKGPPRPLAANEQIDRLRAALELIARRCAYIPQARGVGELASEALKGPT